MSWWTPGLDRTSAGVTPSSLPSSSCFPLAGCCTSSSSSSPPSSSSLRLRGEGRFVTPTVVAAFFSPFVIVVVVAKGSSSAALLPLRSAFPSSGTCGSSCRGADTLQRIAPARTLLLLLLLRAHPPSFFVVAAAVAHPLRDRWKEARPRRKACSSDHGGGGLFDLSASVLQQRTQSKSSIDAPRTNVQHSLRQWRVDSILERKTFRKNSLDLWK
jgi:hypothetical protein